jgi:hypothetical protein
MPGDVNLGVTVTPITPRENRYKIKWLELLGHITFGDWTFEEE